MDADALIGTVLGTNYTLQKVIGQGEMGVVFLAQQSNPDRQVAVKVLLPLLPPSSDQYPIFLKRLQSEINTVSSLKHPNIMQIYEHGEYKDLIYLVMPYVNGGTLRNEMEREGPFPLPKALSYLEQTAAALDFAHAHGVIHGNVQPANILIQDEGQLVLTDFGMVKIFYEMNLADSFRIRDRMPIETLDYMAPEQVVGDKISTHVDLYSLGVVLYQMLTGTVPFQSSMVGQHQYTQPYAPRLLRPDLPVAAERVMLKALATYPTNRYMHARDFAQAFRQALQTSDAVQKSASSPAPNLNKNVQRTDVIKKTSFTIPSMSGFWGSAVSQVPIVPVQLPITPNVQPPGAPNVQPSGALNQEENIPPPPMPVSWPSWRWPGAEGAGVSFASQSTIADSPILPLSMRQSVAPGPPLAAQKTKVPARRGRMFTFVLIIVLLALLISSAFVYANSNATRSSVKPGAVAVHSGGVHTPVMHTSPPKSTTNGGVNTTDNYVGPGTRSFQVGAHPLLVIKGQGSDVNIQAGNAGTVVVTAKAHGNGNSAGILYNQANDGQGHDRISIATNPGYMNIDYDITAPSTTVVQVQVDGGSIAVDGMSGVTIDTGGGNLDIENVHGPVNVYTDNGDITADALTGSMDMEVGNGGSIRASNVKGSLKAISHSGDVVVREAALNGASVLETNYGSVRFDGTIDPQGTYMMRTINGNIDLTFPGNAAFQLAASTGSGSVYNAFGSTIVGYGPRAQIMANITNGSVTVNRAA
jgi:serine/threonine protein kinase